MRPDEVVARVARQFSVSSDLVEVERVTGGLVNEVFRAHLGSSSVIVKYAPPYVAALPSIALSPRRICIEARCLRELGPGGGLDGVVSSRVRAPRLIDLDVATHVLMMEDLGPLPDLGERLMRGDGVDPALGATLGGFVGRLHASSRKLPELLREIDNRDVQETRLRTQYRQVGTWLAESGCPEHAILGARAADLGARLLGPGPCLTMGDLWPRSVLTDGETLGVIDWEFAHAGNPAQDLGHLAAHLWMHARRAPTEHRARTIDVLRESFSRGYRDEIARLGADDLITPEVVRDANVHAGCEILARVLASLATEAARRAMLGIEVLFSIG